MPMIEWTLFNNVFYLFSYINYCFEEVIIIVMVMGESIVYFQEYFEEELLLL